MHLFENWPKTFNLSMNCISSMIHLNTVSGQLKIQCIEFVPNDYINTEQIKINVMTSHDVSSDVSSDLVSFNFFQIILMAIIILALYKL